MMKRFAVALMGFFVCASTLNAQLLDSGYQEFSGRMNFYSLNYGTGQITSSNPGQNFGPNILWDSTTPTGFFRGSDLVTSPPEETLDWGDLPGLAAALINGFQIGYVTDSLTPVDIEVNFYGDGNGFGDASTTAARFTLAGLPGSAGGGLEGFIVDVDLEGGFEFLLGGADLDAFAGADFEYGYNFVGGAGTGTAIGPIIATGGFGEEDVFDTYEPGAQADGAPHTGSFFFGGTPFAQFHMRLYTVPEPGVLGLLALCGLGLVAQRRRK